MLSIKSYVYSKLSTNAALLAAIGGTTHITDMYPEGIKIFPMVVMTEEGQIDKEYVDNKPAMSEVRVKIDIFVKIDGSKNTTDIGIIVGGIFSDLFFHCGMNGEVPDPNEAVRHRVMRFSRGLFPSEIV